MAEPIVAAPIPATAPTLEPDPTLMPSLKGAGDNMQSSFSRLEAFTSEPGGPENAPPKRPGASAPKAPTAEPPKPEEDDEPAVPDKPAEPNPKDTPATKTDKPNAEPGKVKRPSEIMREELAQRKTRIEALEKELTELKKPKEDPEKVELKTKYDAHDKRLKELEQELRYTAYERSQEYKEKYEKPFVDAIALARQKVTALDVITETGETRPATPEDFDRILMQPSDREARILAKQMFGDDYAIAMQHREKVLDLNGVRQTKLEEFRKNGAELEKQAGELRTKQQTEMRQLQANLRKNAFDGFKQRFPEISQPAEGDKEGSDILSKDVAVTDMLFGENNFPPEKLQELHGEMRNRAAHFGHVLHLNRQLSKQLTELQEKLKQFDDSQPGEGTGARAKPSGPAPDTMQGALAGFDRIAKPSTGF